MGVKVQIIAEIGVNHNGDLILAKKLIDAAIESGADAVKFQKRNLESLYRKEALENPNSESQGFEILLAELKKIELSKEDYFDIVNDSNFNDSITLYLDQNPAVIGACCGSTPRHIKILKSLILKKEKYAFKNKTF